MSSATWWKSAGWRRRRVMAGVVGVGVLMWGWFGGGMGGVLLGGSPQIVHRPQAGTRVPTSG